MSVYYALEDGRPVAVVVELNNLPFEAYQYQVLSNRLAQLNVDGLINPDSVVSKEHEALRKWFYELHPDKKPLNP